MLVFLALYDVNGNWIYWLVGAFIGIDVDLLQVLAGNKI